MVSGLEVLPQRPRASGDPGPALTWTPSKAPLSNSSGGRAAADFRSTHAACWASDSSSAGAPAGLAVPRGVPHLVIRHWRLPLHRSGWPGSPDDQSHFTP